MTAFLSPAMVRQIQTQYGTPIFVYDLATLVRSAKTALGMPNPFGLTVRCAMKACPNAAILRLFQRLGLHVDASSGFEVYRARRAGIPLSDVQLTAQELPGDLRALVQAGLLFNATSLHQLDHFGRLFPGHEASIRLNPGLGSGHNRRANVGGPSASFGIWHEHLAEVKQIQEAHNLQITRLHSHIGSGADPAVWQRCAELTLRLAHHFPQVHTVNLGGGFKIARAPGESDTDLRAVGQAITSQLTRFQAEDSAHRALRLEIEPGTYLVARAGAIVSSVVDVKDTLPPEGNGEGDHEGYRFVVVDSGMTDNLRPTLYGAFHPLQLVPATAEERSEDDYVVVGHCCESGDLLTPAPGAPETLQPRRLRKPSVGDALVIGDTGAYGASMAATNYNSFPRSAELLLMPDGELHVTRRRQGWEEMVAGEQVPAALDVLLTELEPDSTVRSP